MSRNITAFVVTGNKVNACLDSYEDEIENIPVNGKVETEKLDKGMVIAKA